MQDRRADAVCIKAAGARYRVSAVNPMPRRLVAGGCVSSRMAERMAVMASSWCLYLCLSSSSLRAKAELEARSSRRRTNARKRPVKSSTGSSLRQG